MVLFLLDKWRPVPRISLSTRRVALDVGPATVTKSTRLHGSNHPTTAQLAHQLKSAHELISAMRLRDRARREEAAGGKKTFHERAFAPGWLE